MVDTVELPTIDSFLEKEYGPDHKKEFRTLIDKGQVKLKEGTYSRVSWNLYQQLSALGYHSLADKIIHWRNNIQVILETMFPRQVKWV